MPLYGPVISRGLHTARFMYPFVCSRAFGSFLSLAAVSNAARERPRTGFRWTDVFISLTYIPRSVMAGS